MNRAELVEAGLRNRSWKPSDTTNEFELDARKELQRALDELASRVPTGLIPVVAPVTLFPLVSGGESVTVESTGDPYVLRFSPQVPPLVGAAKPPYPATDGTWDGIFYITWTLADGTERTSRCRTFWYEATLAGNRTYYVSLEKPHNLPLAFSGATYKLYAPCFYLPDNVSRVWSGTIPGDSERSLRLTTRMPPYNRFGQGVPSLFERREAFQIRAPSYTPPVRLQDETHWVGPESPGKFKYLFTYVWGKKPSQDLSPGGTQDPQWESGVSPASETIEPSWHMAAVKVTLPNNDYEMNFGDNSTKRYGRSGIRKRIYRARITSTPGGTHPVEADEVFEFLAEVDGLATEYLDDGSVLPDYSRRAPETGVYYAYRTDCLADAERRAEIVLSQRPPRLLADTDVPAVDPLLTKALIDLLTGNIANFDKAMEERAFWRKEAEESIRNFRSSVGARGNVVDPVPYTGYSSSGSLTGLRLGGYRVVL